MRQGFAVSDPHPAVAAATPQQLSPIYFAVIFGWTMSAVSATMCAVVRWPLGSPHWFVFVKAFLLLASVISCAATLVVWRVEGRGGSYATVLVSTLAVIFLPCLAWLMGSAADSVTYPVLLGLLAVGARPAVAAVRGMPRRQPIFAVVCGCLAGLGYFLLINSKGYATVLTPELALVGTQHLDTLFHASIANMLVKHGALSTGLDGLVPIKYHVLSHIWLGCLSLWLGVTTLEGYYIGAQVVAIPMLLFSLVLATHLLRRAGEGLADSALTTLVPLLLLFVADLFGWTSYLVSESYFLAMILFLLSLPLLAEMADDRFRFRLDMRIVALFVVGILILISKISVGMIFWAAAGFLLWRKAGLTILNLMKLAPPILLLVWLGTAISSPDTGTYVHALSPFSFVREFPNGAWPNVLANLVLLYGARQVWLSGSPRDKRCAEVFAIIAIGSLIPALLFEIGGGSAYYFANVGTWACIVFVSAYGVAIFEKRSPGLAKPGFVLAAILVLALATGEKRHSVGEACGPVRGAAGAGARADRQGGRRTDNHMATHRCASGSRSSSSPGVGGRRAADARSAGETDAAIDRADAGYPRRGVRSSGQSGFLDHLRGLSRQSLFCSRGTRRADVEGARSVFAQMRQGSLLWLHSLQARCEFGAINRLPALRPGHGFGIYSGICS